VLGCRKPPSVSPDCCGRHRMPLPLIRARAIASQRSRTGKGLAPVFAENSWARQLKMVRQPTVIYYPLAARRTEIAGQLRVAALHH
jgi:hypothetical protein